MYVDEVRKLKPDFSSEIESLKTYLRLGCIHNYGSIELLMEHHHLTDESLHFLEKEGFNYFIKEDEYNNETRKWLVVDLNNI